MSYHSHIPAGGIERICDVCGVRRDMRKLRAAGKYLVCEKHPKWVPRETLDALPDIGGYGVESVKNARGMTARDTFEASELDIFNFVARDTVIGGATYVITGGALGSPSFANYVGGVVWQGIYLYEMIAEAARPQAWITDARTRLRACAEWLVSHQAAGPEISGSVSSDLLWGGYEDLTGANTFSSAASALAGIVLLRSYQLFGDSRYLTAARACAWFLRSCQCGDKLVAYPSSSDAAGLSPKHHGIWTGTITFSGGSYYFDHRYFPNGITGIEFLTLFKSVAGDETIGSATTTGYFAASRAALVSVCMAEARAFWTDPQWSVDDATAIQGFSTETPRDSFSSYPLDKGVGAGSGSWGYSDGQLATGTTIRMATWAQALRSLRALDGDSARVTGIFDWLMTFTANIAYDLPATTDGRVVSGYDDRYLYGTMKGPFDVRYAPPLFLLVRAGSPLTAVTLAGSSIYELRSAGLLAGLYSSRQRAHFLALKQTLAEPRARAVVDSNDGKKIPLGILGHSGFSWQPFTGTNSRQANPEWAAQTGLIYRQEPKVSTGRWAHEGGGLV